MNGTCLQGYITISYNRLKSKLGEPLRGGDKSTVEWEIEINRVVATIYDYKWQSRQNDHIEHFHIGGEDESALSVVSHLFPDALVVSAFKKLSP